MILEVKLIKMGYVQISINFLHWIKFLNTSALSMRLVYGNTRPRLI